MSSNRKIKACYLRWAKNAGGTSCTDIDFSIKAEAFKQELQELIDTGCVDSNGWLNLRICENPSPEGKGQYSHKIRLIL